MELHVGQRWLNIFDGVTRLIEIRDVIFADIASCVVLTSNSTKYPVGEILQFYMFPIATGYNQWFEYLPGQEKPKE